jgi:hypothetical protein
MKKECTDSSTRDIKSKFTSELVSEIQKTFVNNRDEYTIDEIAYAIHRQIELCRYEAEIDVIL